MRSAAARVPRNSTNPRFSPTDAVATGRSAAVRVATSPEVASVKVFAFILGLLSAGSAFAQPIFVHSGASNPTSEGWLLETFGSSATSFGIVDGSTSAWVLRDTVGTSGNYRYYRRDPTPVASQVVTAGWSLRWIVRVPVVDPNPRGSVHVFVKIGALNGYAWNVGTRADGNAFVEVAPDPLNSAAVGPQFTLTGGLGAYHVYDVVWHPATAKCDLSVDGQLLHTDYAGWISAQSPQVIFGAGMKGPTEARFAYFEFRKGTDLPVETKGTTWGAIKAAYRP
jgi:hypothetical protein